MMMAVSSSVNGMWSNFGLMILGTYFRAIFRWITVKDLNKMIFSSELTEESPYYFLQGIKYGLESYHELFKRLCRFGY